MAEENVMKKKVNPIKLIALGFIVLIAIGTLLLMLPAASREGKSAGFVDALFTATSATTVTGLTVKDTQSYFSPLGHFIIMALIQLGGLGYMTIMSFIFIFGANMKLSGGIYMKESMGMPSFGEIYKFARNTAAYVFVLEIIGATALFLSWKGSIESGTLAAKYAVFHSISAFNNAGFDLVGGLGTQMGNTGVALAIAALTILGGIGFIVISELHKKIKSKEHRLSLHAKIALTTTVALLAIGTLGIFAFESGSSKELGSLSLTEKIGVSTFQSVTARTSGFSLIDFGGASAATLFLVAILMFVGASPGGTGGGIKTTTFAAATMTFFSFVRGKRDTEIYGRRLSHEAISKAFATIFVSVTLIIVASMTISAIEPQSFENIIFETVSAFSTTGLSAGITPMLSTASKLIIALVMFAGRVGPLGLLILLLERKKIRRLPEEDILVG